MKTKALFLALAILGSSLFATAQQVVPESIKTECDKKLLKKIKREITTSDVLALMSENSVAKFHIVCYVNDENIVELKSIEGNLEAIEQSIMKTFDRKEIKCPNETRGVFFEFILTLKKLKP